MEPTGPSLSNSKQAQNVVTKYAGFNDFMMKHLIKKGDPATNNRPITNTRIGDKDSQIYGGSYSIPETEYQTFLQLYAKDILSTNKKEYLTERQLEQDGPILIDIDLRHDYETDERQYTRDHIEDMVHIYLEELKEMFQYDDASKFKIFILEKPSVNRVSEKNCTKDGIHIIIGLKADRVVQAILRERVMPKVAEAWDGLPIINSWEDVFDKGGLAVIWF